MLANDGEKLALGGGAGRQGVRVDAVGLGSNGDIVTICFHGRRREPLGEELLHTVRQRHTRSIASRS